MNQRQKIIVKGVVQGVGFRPFVYNLAKSLNLRGYVNNSSKGVTIEIEGDNSEAFVERLSKDAPPLSQIVSIDVSQLPYHGYQDFKILESEDEGSFTLISADVSICQDCFREMLDRKDRRYLYPFINCTNCGPRYTITKSVPYDRPNTTMSVFKMCPDCKREYHDPSDRRFHAQPNACPVCGPEVKLRVKSGKLKVNRKDNPIEETIKLLKQGAIVAIKGLGGFHIACDATNEEAVKRLRMKKRKSNKPFGLMAPDIETVRKFCEVSREEETLLLSNKRPIVLLKKSGNHLPEEVSPNNPCIGFMLPYTPLHYLLFYHPVDSSSILQPSSLSANFDALVMTSGNISEEPIVIDNNEAIEKLSGIADAFLIHNRDIFMRVDDSVVRLIHFKTNRPVTYFIRRSRGYVPDVVALHDEGPEVLGCGADIKNIFTLTKGSFAIPSQHIGDMENYETLQFFEESLKNLKSVYRVVPEALAHDLHPMYLSTQWALRQEGIKKIGIQHHYAHVASVMAERGIKDKVIGVSFDGTGYGTDGNLWGGEFLIADIRGFRRAGHLKYTPLPGGENAIREPWRIAVSYIRDAAGEAVIPYLKSIGFIKRYGAQQIDTLLKVIANRQFSPLSSGAGRLFDAISAMIGVCDQNTFEGEAAIALEAAAVPGIMQDYPVDIKFRETMEVDFSHTVLGILNDMVKGEEKGVISSKFHNTIITAIQRVVEKLSSLHQIKEVVLCGGVFQNMYLLERAINGLESAGMSVFIHDKVPTNDAGISLGQAYIIRERIKEGIA
ncbi:MAG TPA: carbamoyltransferase HypF [Thermodesulfovibrionales bacterium]|nr:carbamoyltransferase HypF [Thermodesulfovibrionales bacterium]